MKLKVLCIGAGILAGLAGAAEIGFAETVTLGQKLKLEGLITSRNGAGLTLRSKDGDVAVLLTDNTDVSASKGRLGLVKKQLAATALVPGLKVGVEGVGDEKGRLIATKIHFTGGDLKEAQAIQAGLAPVNSQLQSTEQQVQANQQGVAANQQQIGQLKTDQADMARRFGELGEYDTKGEATVYFAVGSAAVSADGQRDLAKLAETAKPLEGYLIEVEGFADSSGNVAVNQKLSLERSQAVVNWLAQQGGIPFVRMLAPGAMSTAEPAASNETAQGRAQNRRVVAKVLVNKGIAQP